MYPSQVRARILEVHRSLRASLDRVVALADAVDGGTATVGALRAEIDDLARSLRDHDALEDEILAPVLADTDAFADVRTRQLVEHHEAHRRELEQGLQRLVNTHSDVGAIALLARETMAALRADMDQEERELLDPGVLRDDTITITPSA
jgi:iron-sulfur cluster repair protein YtfE (RIC family)